MPDPRFFTTSAPLSLTEAARLAEGDLVEQSEQTATITHVARAEGTDLGGAAVFINHPKYIDSLLANPPAACIVPKKMLEKSLESGLGAKTGLIACDSARAGFALLAAAMHASLAELTRLPDSIPEPVLGKDCYVASSAILSPGVELGDGCIIGHNTVIAPGVKLGSGCHIGPNVTISHLIAGNGCRVLAGARIGEAGFGFVMAGGRQRRVPQLGRVLFGNEVEIGANTTVDRGALGDTSIGDSTKIDNLAQIGHNVVIGKNCALAGMCGISGSCVIGDGAMLGGQVVLSDHINVGDGAIIYARAALMRDVPAGEAWAGMPAKPARQYFKEVATLAKLSKKGAKTSDD